MATRDEAYASWSADFSNKAGRAPNSEDINDFENAWKQSSDASVSGGAGLDSATKTWEQLAAESSANTATRFQRPTASDGGVGGSADVDGNGQIDPQRTSGSATGSATGSTSAGSTVMSSWSAPVAPQVDPATKARQDALYQTLLARSQQATAVGRDDPAVRGQADAYAANEERSSRNYLADMAEKLGPNANMRGETRMANERVGQRTGQFEAELMGRELQARREEIAQALTSMQGMLTADQQMQLAAELARIDTAIKQQGMVLQEKGLDTGWNSALMQNDQFLRQLAQQQLYNDNYWVRQNAPYSSY